MKFRTDDLAFAVILIVLGVLQIAQVLNYGNFPAWLILICVGIAYITKR